MSWSYCTFATYFKTSGSFSTTVTTTMKGWIPAGTTAVKLQVPEERVGTFCGSVVTQNGHRVKHYFLVSLAAQNT